ncbi:hypothetical protein [Paenibacillus sp. FSL R10-2736]|uniref:hypothetical protein n=1 Tax=Paenibacillus sp. FSL R10-2736 TaxID=2954692 RepID=UPI0030FB9209
MRIINKTRKITMLCLVFCLFLIPNMVSAATENLSVSNVFPMETRYSQTFTPDRPDFKAILNVNSLSGLSSGSNLKVTIQKYNPSTGLFEDRGDVYISSNGSNTFYSTDNGVLHRLKITTTSSTWVNFYATISY